MNYLPDPKEYPENRLFALDLLRGLDMFYLVSLGFLYAFFQAMGREDLKIFFATHQWGGFTLCDLIMPLFIFMCGAALPLAMTRRLDANGKPTMAFHTHVWGRFLMLWVFGMLAQGNLTSLDINKIHIYSNTLQAIAVGYVVAAYVLIVKSRLFHIAVMIALAAFYGFYIHFSGDYSCTGNATKPVELWVLGHLLPAGSEILKNAPEAKYTWFLPSVMMPVITLCGAFSTEILLSKNWSTWKRAAILFTCGAVSVAIGFGLKALGVPMIKHFFTVSFTFAAIGYSMLLLAALYVLADIWKLRRGTGLLLLFGQCALSAYFCKAIFFAPVRSLSERLFSGFIQFVPTAYSDSVIEVGFILLTTVLIALYRRARR